jgi:hypothetical protein
MSTRGPAPILDALRQRLQGLDGGTRRRRAVLPFGVPVIDARLPDGGLALGALHEVAGGGNGTVDGAAAALFAAGIAARTRGRVLWCVTRQDLFAPAIAAAGLAPDRVIYVEAGDEKTLLACFEEGLRHGRGLGGLHGEHSGLGAVVAEVMRLSMTASRRLQLAAESSGAIGIAIRRFPAFPRTQKSNTGAKLKSGAAAEDSLPPCGWVVQYVTTMPHRTTPTPSPQGGGGEIAAAANRTLASEQAAGRGHPPDHLNYFFAQPTAAVTRWRVSALPSAPLPVAGVGRARWQLELIRCRGGEGACFDVEACDAQGRLALSADLAHGQGQEATRQRRTAG